MLLDDVAQYVEVVAKPEQARHAIDRAIRIAARYIQTRRGMMFSLSGGLATMRSGVPYAIAAKMAYPDRVVIGSAGDGAMQMSGINSLIDISKYWRGWSDPRLIVLVLINRDFNYAEYARSLGLNGLRIDNPGQVASAWDEALRADRPTVIDAVVNADLPTLPPQLTSEQQEHLARALAQGDEDAEGVEVQLVEQGVSG